MAICAPCKKGKHAFCEEEWDPDPGAPGHGMTLCMCQDDEHFEAEWEI